MSLCLNVVANSCIAVGIWASAFAFFVFVPDFWARALVSFCLYMLLGGGWRVGGETKSSSWR